MEIINTSKIRNHGLLDSKIDLLGVKSGKVYFKSGKDQNEKIFSIEAEALSRHFVMESSQVPEIDSAVYEQIRSKTIRF